MQTGCLSPSRFIAPAFLLLMMWPIPLTGGELPVACAMTKITNPWLVLWYHSFFSFPLRYSPARSKKRKMGLSLHTHSFKVEQEYHMHMRMSRVFLHVATAFESAAECALVGILKITTNG
jgi:hypothetical protein